MECCDPNSMINISKSPQPAELLKYKKSHPNPRYDGPGFTEVKDAIRKSLLAEQGFICAYCMQSLEDDPLKTKIEHWHSQKKYPKETLEYKNLLVVCMGKGSNGETHCDTAKSSFDGMGGRDLNYNPSKPEHDVERKYRYLRDGEITGDVPVLQDIEILNLNQKRLVNDRKAIWAAVQKVLDKMPGQRNRKEIEHILNTWLIPTNGRKKPYCGVAIYYLRKKLNSLSRS